MMLALQTLRESAQASVGGGADRARTLAQHLGGAPGIEAHDDPQKNGLRLVSRQRGDQLDGGVRRYRSGGLFRDFDGARFRCASCCGEHGRGS